MSYTSASPIITLALVSLLCAYGSIAAAAAARSGVETDPTPIHLNFIHRHGARTEPFVQGSILNWGHVVLSDQGAEMAKSLGRFLMSEYGPESRRALLPAEYSTTAINSRSTDFERTVRTGVGVLYGLYNQSNAIPYLYHQVPQFDYMMGYFYSWPSAVLREAYINTFNPNHNEITLSVVNQTVLNKLGKVLDTTICGTEQTTCALLAEDIGTCRLSNDPSISPYLKHFLDNGKLFTLQSQSFAWQYLYDTKGIQKRYWEHTGPYGRLLAKEWVMNMKGKFNGENKAVMDHYSAHDITIYGFWVAIGVVNTSTTDLKILIPSFTSAAIAELFADRTIRLRYARCDQEYGSGYPFHWEDEHLRMGCISATGEKFWSDRCSIDEVERFIDSQKPEAEVPVCYADPRDVAQTKCDEMGTIPSSPHCIRYRQNCGNMSCSKPFVLDRTTWACVKPQAPTHKPLKAGPAVAIAASALLMGVVLGLFLRLCCHRSNAAYQRVGRDGDSGNTSGSLAVDESDTTFNKFLKSNV